MELSTKFLPYLIFGFSITFFECFCSRRTQILKQLSTQIIPINGDILEPTTGEDYVYYQTENMAYPILTDSLFEQSMQCGSLERKVQYCQWVEVRHSQTIKRGNKTITKYYYTYHKQWLRYQLSSLFFHNPIYFNPTVPTVPDLTISGNSTKAGVYNISPDMTLVGSRSYFYPSENDILNFEKSAASSEFQYAGKGIFYSSYERGFLEKILRVAQFFDLKSDLIDWCTPGDRRVWFEIWKPNSTTVVGSRFDGTIEPFIFHDYKIGSVHSGEIELNEVLKDNTSGFPTVMKWILRALIVFYFAVSIYDGRPDFFGVTCLVFCIVLGMLAPVKFNFNIWGNVSLSLFCGLGVFLVKQQENF